ncbi:MAG: hypothetical protein ACE366_20735 [Bradymonadia bacterium]
MTQGQSPNDTQALDPFRMQVFKSRRQLIKKLDVETYDQGHVLYPCPNCGHPVVVTDAFPESMGEGPIEAFIEGLTQSWWSVRLHLPHAQCESCGHEGPFVASAALYSHFIKTSGFDWSVELEAPEGEVPGAARCWRVDARGKAVELEAPENELMFRDQVGAFFDLRSGWRMLVQGAVEAETSLAVEVEPGYIIGARPGDPQDPDPASREDAALEEVLGHSAPRRYDTLEFLGRADDPLDLLAAEESPAAWLGPHSEAVHGGALEMFALSDANRMLRAIESLAEVYGVQVTSVMQGEELEDAGVQVSLSAGTVSQMLPFDAFYLRTLHAGMTFADGAAVWFGPAIRATAEGRDLVTRLTEALEDWMISVEDGATLVIAREDAADDGRYRWPLMTLVGRAQEGVDALLDMLGYDHAEDTFRRDAHDLTRCPVTGGPARVGKVIRPLDLLGVDPRTLAGVVIGKHVVVYTLEGPSHSTLLEADPRRDLQRLETAYQEGLGKAHLKVLALRKLPVDESEAWLIVAADAGSLVLEPGRIHQVMGSAGVPGGEIAALSHAYSFFPDALVLTKGALSPKTLRALRRSAHEAVRGVFPGRDWPLAVARPIKLSVAPVGQSELL